MYNFIFIGTEKFYSEKTIMKKKILGSIICICLSLSLCICTVSEVSAANDITFAKTNFLN